MAACMEICEYGRLKDCSRVDSYSCKHLLNTTKGLQPIHITGNFGELGKDGQILKLASLYVARAPMVLNIQITKFKFTNTN